MPIRGSRFGVVVSVLLVASCSTHDDASSAVDSELTTRAQQTHANLLHAQSTVVLAHDHRLTTAELDGALAGGLSAITMELATDGVEWVGGTRVMPPTTPMKARFEAGLAEASRLVAASGGRYVIARDVADIRSAKALGKLAIVIGSEGAAQLDPDVAGGTMAQQAADAIAKVDGYYAQGWRKTQTRWTTDNALWVPNAASLSYVGQAVVGEMNRRGILVDITHLDASRLDSVLAASNAPILHSHEYPITADAKFPSYALDAASLLKIAASGGGYGVVGVQFLGWFYNRSTATLAQLAKNVRALTNVVGVDHVGLGSDYMPPDDYCGDPLTCWDYIVPDVSKMSQLTLALVQEGFSDDEIKKLLGENLLALYDRAWNPTRGYGGGHATFYTCTNASTDPACVAARSHRGQGDFDHRPVSCLSAISAGPIALQLAYTGGAWGYYALDGNLHPCADGSLLAVSFGSGAGNGQLAVCADGATDALCAGARASGGSGTSSERAVSCVHPTVPGVIGLQLLNQGGAWSYYNVAGQVAACAPASTLAVRWGGAANGTAEVQLCDDELTNPTCAAAAANGGSGSGAVRAISCYNSTPSEAAHGTVALQLAYRDGRWQYYDIAASLHPCVAGSVLVARN